MEDKLKGRMKEAAGAFTGDENRKAEGRAQQSKVEAAEAAKQREKTRQAEAEAKAAEKERDRQRRKDKGPLGGLGDTLTGRYSPEDRLEKLGVLPSPPTFPLALVSADSSARLRTPALLRSNAA